VAVCAFHLEIFGPPKGKSDELPPPPTIANMPPRCQWLSGRLSTPQTLVRSSQTSSRTYATYEPAPIVKNPLRRRKGGDLGSHLPKNVIPPNSLIPAYPYGDHALYKQANHGLYGEQMIQFGNNVSEKTETKTRRDWKPNVLNKALYSVALKKKVKLRITARVLKTMDREGGLDEYLLKDNEHRLKELGPLGWALRWTLMQKPEVVERMRAEAAALGLDQATIDRQWPTAEMQQKISQAGLVKASDLVSEVYNEAEEDVEEFDAEGEPLDDAPQQNYTQAERRAMKEAGFEYVAALKAAQRYLDRATVDSEESGLKLAFIRTKERVEAAERNKQNFTKKLSEQFSAQDVADTRAKFSLEPKMTDDQVRKIAYNQWRRAQIEEMGSYEAWRAKIDADKNEQLKAIFGQDAQDINVKKEYAASNAALIAEAESAVTNRSLKPSQKQYLLNAMRKAHMAIKAKDSGGKKAYQMAVLENMRGSQPGSLRQISRKAEKGDDAWAALVTSANSSASTSRLSA
jgi:large subunit ribosomal protein L28